MHILTNLIRKSLTINKVKENKNWETIIMINITTKNQKLHMMNRSCHKRVDPRAQFNRDRRMIIDR